MELIINFNLEREMKKSINLLALFILLLVVSCGDIVDSDENIKKTAVTYAKVLENQETGVILPLKEIGRAHV